MRAGLGGLVRGLIVNLVVIGVVIAVIGGVAVVHNITVLRDIALFIGVIAFVIVIAVGFVGFLDIGADLVNRLCDRGVDRVVAIGADVLDRGRLSSSGTLRKVVGRRGARRGAAERYRTGTVGGWPVQVAAALMPAPTRERWLEDVAVSLYDFAVEDHRALIRDFLAHAPVVIATAWLTELPRRTRGGGRPPKPPR